MNFPFLKQEKFGLRVQETFIGNKCEIFIPQYYIVKGDKGAIAKDLGDKIESMGIFWFRVDSRDFYELQLPMKIVFEFSEVEVRKMKLKPEIPEMTFYVYTLKNGDAFVYDILIKKDIDKLKLDFIEKMIEKANMPSFVPYNDTLQLFINAMEATGFDDLAVNSVNIEILLSEIFRTKGNSYQAFRLGCKGKNDYGYTMTRLTKIPELNSTFTGLIGEDISTQIISAVVKNRSGLKEKTSPIEKLIKY